MVDAASALSFLFVWIGAILFVVIKFFLTKFFKGWKGMIIKVVVSFVLCALAGLVWDICPSASIILVFGVLIIGEMIGFGIVYFAGSIPYLGSTVTYALSIVSPVIVIWIIIAVIGVLLDLIAIIALFVPVFGEIADLIIFEFISPALPIIQMFVLWGSFSAQFAGLSDCIFGISRTAAIPGTGGISIGANIK